MEKEEESSSDTKINFTLKCSILNDSSISFSSLVLLNDTRIAAASSDNIKIYNTKNNFNCDFIILDIEMKSIAKLSNNSFVIGYRSLHMI